jgi:hypothetical protein
MLLFSLTQIGTLIHVIGNVKKDQVSITLILILLMMLRIVSDSLWMPLVTVSCTMKEFVLKELLLEKHTILLLGSENNQKELLIHVLM